MRYTWFGSHRIKSNATAERLLGTGQAGQAHLLTHTYTLLPTHTLSLSLSLPHTHTLSSRQAKAFLTIAS